MADKYDAMIDAVQSTPSSDKYDQMIDAVAGPQQSQPAAQMAGLFGDSGTNPQLPGWIRNISPTNALLTNNPPANIGESVLRGVPATVGSILGAGAGLLGGGPAGMIAGSGLGAASLESARQGASQIYSGVTGTQFTPPGTAIKDIAVQGAFGAAGEGVGLGVAALRGPAINAGAALMRNAAAIPEASGRAALSDLSLLGRAPSNEQVSTAYDAFHAASGTVSRKAAVAASEDPFDTVARAMGDMRDASVKLQQGTLTTQEAVNASQAGRVIRDQKMRGNEMAREVGDAANDLKGQFDNFIQKGMGPRSEIQNIPVAQQIVREETPIASRIVPKSDVFQSASSLIPDRVNVPTRESKDILSDVKRVVTITNNARLNGLLPKAIMTDTEKSIYDQFAPAIESAAEHNIPIESLLTKSEMTSPISGFTEKQVLRKGEPIYSGANRYEFGGTIYDVKYKPGATITGDMPVQVPAKPGFPEWQSARQAAWENNVASDFSSAFPQNLNGSSNQLRGYGTLAGVGAGLGEAGLALSLGHPGVAAVGLGGAIAAPIVQSPAAYGAAIRTAAALSPIAKAVAQGFRFAPGSLAAFYNSPGITSP